MAVWLNACPLHRDTGQVRNFGVRARPQPPMLPKGFAPPNKRAVRFTHCQHENRPSIVSDGGIRVVAHAIPYYPRGFWQREGRLGERRHL